MKLRVYKGTQQVTENTIIDLPTGVVTFHMDTTEPRIPAIAVASAAHIYIYKNLRPYFKFTLPTLEIQPMEKELWAQASTDQMEVDSNFSGELHLIEIPSVRLALEAVKLAHLKCI